MYQLQSRKLISWVRPNISHLDNWITRQYYILCQAIPLTLCCLGVMVVHNGLFEIINTITKDNTFFAQQQIKDY